MFQYDLLPNKNHTIRECKIKITASTIIYHLQMFVHFYTFFYNKFQSDTVQKLTREYLEYWISKNVTAFCLPPYVTFLSVSYSIDKFNRQFQISWKRPTLFQKNFNSQLDTGVLAVSRVWINWRTQVITVCGKTTNTSSLCWFRWQFLTKSKS